MKSLFEPLSIPKPGERILVDGEIYQAVDNEEAAALLDRLYPSIDEASLRNEWRSEFIEVGDRMVTCEEAEAAMKASGWAKEYCILATGFFLFGSLKALERFEEQSLD